VEKKKEEEKANNQNNIDISRHFLCMHACTYSHT